MAVPPTPTLTRTNPNPNPNPDPNPNLSAEMEPLLMMRPPCGDCSAVRRRVNVRVGTRGRVRVGWLLQLEQGGDGLG